MNLFLVHGALKGFIRYSINIVNSNIGVTMLEAREMKVRDKICRCALDSFSFSHPLHDPFGAIILIARNIQSCVELENDFSIPWVLKLKYLHRAEIIKVLQQLSEAAN